ncbi:unnamed protein product, partial [Prorocentrum cordatum]
MPPKGSRNQKRANSRQSEYSCGKAKRGEAEKAKRTENKEHENTLARLRGQLQKDKPHLWEQYKKARKTTKKEWLQIWQQDGHFERIESSKLEEKERVHQGDTLGSWFTYDELLAAQKWTVENSETPYGQRAMARADAIKHYCQR